MKKQRLLKTLLVAVGLFTGVSAWAKAGDVTTNANIDFSNSIVSNKVAGTVNEIAVSGGEISEKGTLYMRNGDNSVVIPTAEYAGSKDIVTVSFDLALGKLSGKNVHFYFYDSSDAKLAGFAFKVYDANITENAFGISMDDFYRSANESDNTKATRITIAFNYATKKVTTTTTCASAKNTSSSYEEDMSFSTPIAKFVIGADYNTQDGTKGRRCQVDNILIQTTEGDYATSQTITLAFQDNDGNDISSLYTGATVFTPDAGSTFTPSAYYPAVMYNGANKYTYTSGGDAFEVTTDATVTLIYTKSARPTYNIKATQSYGGKTNIIYNEDIYEAADYTYYYPKYILDGSTLYQYNSSDDPNASASYWTSANSNVTAAGDYTLTYTAVEGECIYFSEAENITDATQWGFSDYKGKMSNGNSGVFAAKNFTTLDAGIYTIAASAIGRANDRYIDFYKDAVSDANKILRVTSQNNGNEQSAMFSLDASTNIIVDGGYAGGSSGHACDYIYIMKLPSSVSVTVSAAGMATYVPTYDLDFSATGIKAYKAKVTAKGVCTLTAVDEVPAGTPVLLVKDGGATESIPVMTGAAAVTENDLVAGTATTAADGVATTDGDYTNMILNNIGGKVGFYLANGQTVTANRAYLHFNSSLAPAAARMSIVFDDEATGINAVQGEGLKENGSETVYNLNGQRVMAPQKGLYIVGGKKVIVK
jgi:hypothetical protein